MEDAFEGEGDDSRVWLSEKTLVPRVAHVLEDLVAMLACTSVSRGGSQETLINIIDTLVTVSRNRSGDDALTASTFDGLKALMHSQHGDPTFTFGVIAKSLLP